ncbi:MAG: metallophosphoesterase [Flavipsychrobacter sp.]|nr:metallophosphoesterase [Flavipsychrobacter sp.]
MPLTIQYCSDLHLEFDLNRKRIAKYPLVVSGDILLLAGDIVPFTQLEQHNDFFDFVSANYRAAYWVPGNHEYYHSEIKDRSGRVYEAIRDNVFLVNNTTVTVDDTDIICSVLWSNIDPVHEYELGRAMRDFHAIKDGDHNWRIADYNVLHRQCRQYIEDAVQHSKANRKIVMTHHVPTMMNYPEKYKGEAMNQAFATELHDFIESSGLDCWIYGHTHFNVSDYKIGKTQMLTNQLGYVKHGEHTTFQHDKVIKW